MGQEEMLTTGEAAKLLRVARRTVRRWIEAGVFPGAYRVNPLSGSSHFRIPRSEVVRLLEQQKGKDSS